MIHAPYKRSSKDNKYKNKADAIFSYLHKVRMGEDVEGLSDDTVQEYPRTLFKDKPVEKNIPDKPNITFTSVMPKKADGVALGLGHIDDAVRAVTGSPLVLAGALGLAGAGGMYLAYPKIDPPDPTYSQYYGGDKDNEKRRRIVSALTGIGLTSIALAAAHHPEIKSSIFKYLPKKASMLGPVDFVPMGFAQQAVVDSPKMTLDNKYRALQMLSAIPGSPNTMINSTDIVSTAVNTGASSNGYPLGRATVGAIADSILTYAGAKAFGAENPGRLAAGVGLTSLGLRSLF